MLAEFHNRLNFNLSKINYYSKEVILIDLINLSYYQFITLVKKEEEKNLIEVENLEVSYLLKLPLKDLLEKLKNVISYDFFKKGGKQLMKFSNIKLLTEKERKNFNENYQFEVLKDMLIIRCKTINRPNLKPLNENFDLYSKGRKITITTKAINLWISNFKDKNISLTDVQNAINALIISYEDLSIEEIEKQINLMYK